jgi:hypothetical protein
MMGRGKQGEGEGVKGEGRGRAREEPWEGRRMVAFGEGRGAPNCGSRLIAQTRLSLQCHSSATPSVPQPRAGPLAHRCGHIE